MVTSLTSRDGTKDSEQALIKLEWQIHKHQIGGVPVLFTGLSSISHSLSYTLGVSISLRAIAVLLIPRARAGCDETTLLRSSWAFCNFKSKSMFLVSRTIG